MTADAIEVHFGLRLKCLLCDDKTNIKMMTADVTKAHFCL